MRIENNQKLLLTGDSITDCDRGYPIGEGDSLGTGYVAAVDSLLTAAYPERIISVLNSGISGNRVIDLETRWQADVLAHEPDWLSIMIGINDVWRQFDAITKPDQVDIERYESIYRKLLEQTRSKLKGLVLMTPYFIEENRSDPMRELMDRYSAVVKRLSTDYEAVFVDVQSEFDRYLKYRPTQSLCGDRVHPNRTGHLIIARAFLTAIGFDWTLLGE